MLYKCDFYKDRVEFLGHVVTPNGVHVDPKKVEAVSLWPTPEDIFDLRSFPGVVIFIDALLRSCKYCCTFDSFFERI